MHAIPSNAGHSKRSFLPFVVVARVTPSDGGCYFAHRVHAVQLPARADAAPDPGALLLKLPPASRRPHLLLPRLR